jgi:MYXO-CTERM domain-containing protein
MSSNRRLLGLVASACAMLVAGDASAQSPWSYNDPGTLTSGSGTGRVDWMAYAPGMRFPIENGPAFANSQVWGNGGGSGPGGSQCDTVNYDYPWWDNYCETRSWTMPMCPTGQGHQGQDIRPATCDPAVHWAVASEAGSVTNIGSYSVYVTTPSGVRFDYLHGSNVSVSSGEALAKGQRISMVDNEFGGTPTTYHLHFNIRMDVAGVGLVYAPTYMSLIQSYEELMGLGNIPPEGAVEGADCASIRGWAWDEDDPTAAVRVQVAFDAPLGDAGATVVELDADQYRADLCTSLGSCDHGFELEVPLSLRDGNAHPVYVYADDSEGGAGAQLDPSTSTLDCEPPAIPTGVRRDLAGPEALAAWGLSPFWDMSVIDPAALSGIPEGEALDEEPLLVRAQSESQGAWLIDLGYRREVTEAAALRWGLDLGTVALWPDASVEGVPLGPPLREEPFMVTADDGVTIELIDDDICPLDDPACDGGSGDDGGGSGTGDGGSADGAGSTGDGADAGLDDGGTSGSALDDEGAGTGCGCVSSSADAGGRTGVAMSWLLVALLGRRRRIRR